MKRHMRAHGLRRGLFVILGLAMVVLAACLPPPPPPPPPPVPPPAPAPAPVAGPVTDYASDTFSDPWDFSNADDFNITPNVVSSSVSNLAITGGLLHMDALHGQGTIDLSRTIMGSIPYGRDSRAQPIEHVEVHRAHLQHAQHRAGG